MLQARSCMQLIAQLITHIVLQDLEELIEHDKQTELEHLRMHVNVLVAKLNAQESSIANLNKETTELRALNKDLTAHNTVLAAQVDELKKECVAAHADRIAIEKTQTITKSLLDAKISEMKNMNDVCQEVITLRRKYARTALERDSAQKIVADLSTQVHQATDKLQKMRSVMETTGHTRGIQDMATHNLVTAQNLLEAVWDFEELYRRWLLSDQKKSKPDQDKIKENLHKLIELNMRTNPSHATIQKVVISEITRLEETFDEGHWPFLDIHKFFQVPGKRNDIIKHHDITLYYVPHLQAQLKKPAAVGKKDD